MLLELDGAALRAWCAAGLAALTAAREEIDDLNVYPVPDGDTGTNLQLTMAAVAEALVAAPSDLGGTVRAMVTGSLMGARGNSGVILSQLLRGLGDVLAPLEAGSAEDLRLALVASAKSAYGAVATPVEGTLLTVAREAAEGARGSDLAGVVRTAREAAAASLARTPDLLPQLRAAGVVDAGGRGWCVLLEALEQVVTGTTSTARLAPPPLVVRDRSGIAAAREDGSAAFGYEVQYLLRDAADEAVAILRRRLGDLGDSLVVVGGEGLFNVHVHVNDVGAALEAGVDAGRPFRITVTRFEDQLPATQPPTATQEPPAPHQATAAPGGRRLVAVAAGVGLVQLFRHAGAVVVDGGPTANPSTAELLAAVRGCGAAEVVLLPNDGNVLAVATAAAEHAAEDGLAVVVVPTRSVLQGLAAAGAADPQGSFDDDVEGMRAAAAATRWAEVTTAVRASETAVGPCRVGHGLGLLEGHVAVLGDDLEQVALELLHLMVGTGGRQVTVVLGEQAATGAGERLASYVAKTHPTVDVQVVEGGQPHYPFLLGVR